MQGACPTCWSPPLPSRISAQVPPPHTSTGTQYCTARVCALTLPSVLEPARPRGRQHGTDTRGDVKGSETSSRHNSPTGLHLRWVDGRLCHQIRQHQRPHSRLNGGSLSCSIGEVGCKKAISPSMTLPDDHSPETSPSSPCFVGTLAAALIHLHTFHQEPALPKSSGITRTRSGSQHVR